MSITDHVDLSSNLLTGTVPLSVCKRLGNGTSPELLVDCNRVSCDCGCICADDTIGANGTSGYNG